MKASLIVLLIATVSAVRITDPNASYAAKAEHVATNTADIATQVKFSADHLDMHTNNMNTASAECDAQKTHVKNSRNEQLINGNQYPPLKTYGQ